MSRLYKSVLISLAGCLFFVLMSDAAAEVPRLRIGVVEFSEKGEGVSAGQGRVVGELLTGELLSQDMYVIVERLQIDKAMAELASQGGSQVDPSTAVAIGRQVGAQIVVVGTLSSYESEKLLLGRFLDVEKGTVLLAKTVALTSSGLLPAVQTLAQAYLEMEQEEASEALATARRRMDLGQKTAARELYESIARRYPRTDAGDDVLLALARLDFEAGAYFKVADRAADILETFSQSPLAEDALFLLAEAKFFTVFDDPSRPRDPAIFLDEWERQQSGQEEMTPLERVRSKQRIVQESRKKYELLLKQFPKTRYADVVMERLKRITANGGD